MLLQKVALSEVRTKPAIRLETLSLKGGVVHYRFHSDLPLFKKDRFYIEYKQGLNHPPESILLVPFAALMAPIAWAAGADVAMPSLDRTFAESLERASRYWKKCYPRWSFNTRIHAKLVDNHFDTSRHGMLFSGGLDSLATFVHQRDKRPELFNVMGADFPYSESEFVSANQARVFDHFAAKEDVPMSYIFTDISEVLDLERIARLAPNWYGGVQHGLLLTALVAPASCHYLKTLYIASCSHKVDYRYPCGSEPEVVRGLRWASTEVVDDLHEMTRTEKVSHFLKRRDTCRESLRVCWVQHREVNCSRCEKCLRTICELLVNDLDPNLYNFQVNAETLRRLRFRMTRRFYLFFWGNESVLNYWREIQDSVDLDKLKDIHGSRAFFAWFKDYKRLRRSPNRWLVAAWIRLSEIKQDLRAGLERFVLWLVGLPHNAHGDRVR